MATTWRRRDIQRRASERGRRVSGLMRPELLVAIVAVIVAAVALWQALEAQSRAELLAHDLATATSRLRNLDVAPAPASPPARAEGEASIPPLPAPLH